MEIGDCKAYQTTQLSLLGDLSGLNPSDPTHYASIIDLLKKEHSVPLPP